ncbi:MAG: tetratricopeptide repeat protein [Candidatus Competibacter sp.]
MKTLLKPCLGVLALTLGLSACSTTSYPWQRSARSVSRAPVVDRTARQPPANPAQSSRPLSSDLEALPLQDPSLPRESMGPSNGYGDLPPTASYPVEAGGRSRPLGYPPASVEQYQPPAYPPGAATPYSARTQSMPGALPEPQPSVVPMTQRVKPPVAPVPPPVAPTAPAPAASGAPAPVNPTVAMTAPPDPDLDPNPAPVAPPPRATPAAPPPRTADLPPAEINRDGNQAVVALLESADKYVKSNQLDKAGAALERALRIEPRNAGIWYDLAQIRLHQGQYQQAESLASKSNNLAGGNRALQSRNWKLIGSARRAIGNVSGSEEAEARASQFAH